MRGHSTQQGRTFSPEAEKFEGAGNRFGESNPIYYTPRLYQGVTFNTQSSNVTEAPALRDSKIPLKLDLQLHLLDNSNN
jgi:hypothetical protein